jgi:O-antigen biosynthesis protein
VSGKLTWRYRRAVSIAHRIRSSVALRGWRGTLSRISQEFVARPEVDDTLSLLPLDVPFEPFVVASSEQPRLSIVIPVYGKVEYTLACLRSLVANPPTDAFCVMRATSASWAVAMRAPPLPVATS